MSSARRVLAVLLCLALPACGARNASPESVDQMPPAVDGQDRGVEYRRAPAGTPAAAEAAVDAAVRFVCSGQRLLDTPPMQLAEVIRDLWSAAEADRAVSDTVERLVELRDRLAAGRGPTPYRQSVLATRVDSASEARAEVSVWWVGVLSRDGAAPPQARWATTRVALVVEDGRWKVERESTHPGPTPDHSLDTEPISHAELEERLVGFADWEPIR